MDEWKKLQKAALPMKKMWEDGLAHTPEALKPLVEGVLASLDRVDPPVADAKIAGVYIALIGDNVHYKDKPRYDLVRALHLAQGGPRFALEALLSSLAYEQRVASHIGVYTQEFAWIEPSSGEWYFQLKPWVALRDALHDAKPAARKAAQELALETYPTAKPAVRFALAWLFPDEPKLFTEEDERYGLVCEEPPDDVYDLAWLRKVDLGVRLDKEGDLAKMPTPSVLVKHLGEKALSPLRRYVVPGAWGDGEDAVAIVAKISGPGALRILAEGAYREKEVLPTLVSSALADPVSAVTAIAGLLAAPPRAWKRQPITEPACWAVLRAVLRREPGAAKKAKLDASERGVVGRAVEPEAKIAASDELPRALATPPWTITVPPKGKKAAPKKGVAAAAPAVTTVAHEERLDWGDRDPKTLVHVDTSQEADVIERLVAEQKKGETFFPSGLRWVGDDAALRFIREIPVAKWYASADCLEGLLARFGLPMLDSALAYAKRQPDRIEGLLSVDSPRVAPLAGHVYATSKKKSELGAKWLKKFPRAAAVGLVAAIASEKGKARESAEKALALVQKSAPAVVAEVLAAAGATSLVAESAAATAQKPVKAPKLPAFVDVSLVPRPLLAKSGAALSDDTVRDLVMLLAISDRRDPRAEVAEVADALDPDSLDRFAWGLFLQWLVAGGPPKHGFGLDVLGSLGTADTHRALAAIAKAWAPGGLPQRAQASCDVLALARGDSGLLGIHRLTQVRSRALAKHAEKVLSAAAAKRSLTREDLVDRLVPDLGLDDDGSYVFDYGPRKFTLRFDEEMGPYVLDGRGKRLAALPKPAPDDDEALAAEAEAAWKDIKKRVKQITREQSRRLEVALATDRKLSFDHFEAYFARHPLLQHLARRLVWSGGAPSGGPVTFTVADDGRYVDAADARVELDRTAPVSLAHPLRLDARTLGLWGDFFAEHEIVQPFAQLARTTHAIHDDERAAMALTRYTGRTVSTAKILGLDRQGWVRTDPIQGGRVYAWQKPSGGVVAYLPFDPGIYLGQPLDDPEQKLGPVSITRDGGKTELPLGELDPSFFSELVRDLEALFD